MAPRFERHTVSFPFSQIRSARKERQLYVVSPKEAFTIFAMFTGLGCCMGMKEECFGLAIAHMLTRFEKNIFSTCCTPIWLQCGNIKHLDYLSSIHSLGNVNAGHLPNQFRHCGDNGQNFACQLGSTDLSSATRHHGNLLCLWQGGCHFSCNFG